MQLQKNQWVKAPHLDPRDIIIYIKCEKYLAEIEKKEEPSKQELDLWQSNKKEVRKWLINVFEKISSDVFYRYCINEVKESQVKALLSKNILLNVYVFMSTLHQKISNKELINKIFKFLQEQSLLIIERIIIKYPQASAKEGSQKLKNVVKNIDTRESDEFDILRYPSRTGVRIQFQEKQIQETIFYSEIMRTINYLIGLGKSRLIEEDKNCQITNIQGFTMLLEHIFNYTGATENFEDEMIKLVNSFLEGKKCIKKFEEIFKLQNYNNPQKYEDFKQKYQKAKDFKIGQKISSEIQPFPEKNVKEGNCKVNDVTLLRVMTKWVQQLQEKIFSTDKFICKKEEPFKDNDGELIELSQKVKSELSKTLKDTKLRIEVFKQNLLNHSSKIFCQLTSRKQKQTYINQLDGGVYALAATMQQSVSNYMLVYLNTLIFNLIRAPRTASNAITVKKNQQKEMVNDLKRLNLVTLKIGDLLRGKCQANQLQIVSIYKLLVKMTEQTPQVLRIIRVKNRLDKKDNDLLINLFFMNKIQCEIQLSVTQSHVDYKQQKFNSFNHLIYELKRSIFGSFGECACLMAQYNPVVKNYLKEGFPWQKQQPKKIKNKQNNINEQIQQLPFSCKKCGKMKMLSNCTFYLNTYKNKECNQCYEEKLEKDMEYFKGQKFIQQMFRIRYKQDQRQKIDKIKRHFIVCDLRGIKEAIDLEEAILKNQEGIKNSNKIRQGFVIMTDKRKPYPLYCIFQTNQDSFCAVTNAEDIKQGQKPQNKLVFKINSNQENQKAIKKIIIFTLKIGEKYRLVKQRNKINVQEVFLQCTCCQVKSLYLYTSFENHFQTVQKKNLKFLKSAFQQRKQVLILTEKNIKKQLHLINFDFTQIKKLSVDSNKSLEVKNENKVSFLQKFPNLQFMNISNCRLSSISSLNFDNFAKNIHSLKLSYNMIKNIQGLNQLKKLKKLSLDHNNIQVIQNFNNLTEIQEIHLQSNKISVIQNLEPLVNLKQLYLQYNKIDQIKNLVKNMKLCYVNLSYNLLDPSKFVQLETRCRATQIIIKNCELSKEQFKIKRQIEKLKQLNINIVI